MRPIRLIVAALAAFSASAIAQTAPCLSTNDTTNSISGNLSAFTFAGQNTRAYQFTPASASAVMGVRFYTGNSLLTGNRYFSAQIWSDAGGRPGTLLANGTWKLGGPGLSWIGASLDHAVAMAANTPYWVAYVDPGFSDLPEQLSGVGAALATRNGATWTAAGVTQPKIRLYCSPLDDFNVASYGPTCAGTSGASPAAFTNEVPTIGNAAFAVQGTGFVPGAVGVLALGFLPGYPIVTLPGILPPGCAVDNDIAQVLFGTVGTGVPAGHLFFALPIPADPTLAGAFASIQLGGLDTFAVSLPLVTTNAVQVTLY